jgi:Pyridoxamine 5'-phosphate oxidase
MGHDDWKEILNKPLSQKLLTAAIPARMAYTARDGSPRAIPIGFLWDRERFFIATPSIAAKVKALEADPRVALTIDTNDFPPHILLVRGTASITIVDGVPDEYLIASRRYVGDEGMPAFEEQVRATYKQMALITVTPEWAKLIDFETTLPSAVEQLMNQ